MVRDTGSGTGLGLRRVVLDHPYRGSSNLRRDTAGLLRQTSTGAALASGLADADIRAGPSSRYPHRCGGRDRRHGKSAACLLSTGTQPVEVMGGPLRRRRWNEKDKRRLVYEALRSGMGLSRFARSSGLQPSILFRCRNIFAQFVDTGPTGSGPNPTFATVQVVAASLHVSPARLTPPRTVEHAGSGGPWSADAA